MLIWTNFDSFAVMYLTSVDCFKNFNFQKRFASFFPNTKGPEPSFLDAVLVEFFDEILSFGI